MDSNCGDFPNGLLSWKLIQFELDKFGHPLDCRIRIRWIISASFMNKLIFFDTFEGVRGGGLVGCGSFCLRKAAEIGSTGSEMDPFGIWDGSILGLFALVNKFDHLL